MDELTLDGKVYISSKRSAQITGYAKDYIGQLCREGRVEARLVGRNWYVLESSIREHRFGPEEVAAVESHDSFLEKEPEDAWKASNYVSEPISEISTIVSVPSDATPAIEEMQSAWHDWFSRTNELRKTEDSIEGTTDEPEIIEESSIETEQEDEIFTEEPAAINEDVVEEEYIAADEEEEEEIVPIRRTFATPARSVLPISTPRAIYTPLEVNPNYVRREMPVYIPPLQEGRIIRERRVMPKKKSSLVLQTLFILIAIIAAGVGVLGSGKIDVLISQSVSRYSPIQYVAGVSSFQKVNK